MYFVCKPSKIQIYLNTGYKSIAAIKNELGCDAIINGGLYDMRSFLPVGWLKVDGKNIRTEDWFDIGFGWNDKTLVMDGTNNIWAYKNYIACVALIKHGATIDPLNYDAALGGKRGRTAIGIRADGRVVLYCAQDGTSWALTPEQLREEMWNLGCDSAIMLDGGGSSQCIMPNGTIYSSRIVQNYIAVWTDKDGQVANPQQPATPTQPKQDVCPYAEPTRTIWPYAKGNDVRWLQWQLNRYAAQLGYEALTVDGDFGAKTYKALWKFQKTWMVVPDCICGPKTRDKLIGRDKK